MIGYEGAPRYVQLLIALTGDQELVPPGLILESDRPEWKFLTRTTLGGGTFHPTSAAGTICEALLYNPAPAAGQPGVIGICTHARAQLTAAQNVDARFVRAALPPAGFADDNTGPLDTRDNRLIATRGTTLRVMESTPAAADGGISFDSVALAIGERYDFCGDLDVVVLAPSTGLLLLTTAVGVNTMRGAFRWYERSIRPEEGPVT